MSSFDPASAFLGHYTQTDGTVEFYTRVAGQLRPTDVVIDLGAGRGGWYEDDTSEPRRAIRALRDRCARLIGVDVDDAVLENRSTTENHVMDAGRVPLPDAVADLIVADFVLEHVKNPLDFVAEVDRLLKPGGLFCARTPHALNYISLGARILPKATHEWVMGAVQEDRQTEDVFEAYYRMNKLSEINTLFRGWKNYSYIFRTEPGYYFGSCFVHNFLSHLHWLMPAVFSANLMVFVLKQEDREEEKV